MAESVVTQIYYAVAFVGDSLSLLGANDCRWLKLVCACAAVCSIYTVPGFTPDASRSEICHEGSILAPNRTFAA